MTITDVLAPFGIAEDEYAAELDRQLRQVASPGATALTESEQQVLDRFGGIAAPDPAGAGAVDDGTVPLRVATANLAEQIRDSITVSDAAALLGVDGSRIRHRITERALYGFKLGGRLRLPRWQFTDDGGTIPGLRTVLAALSVELHPAEVAGFLTTPDPDLTIAERPTSPRDWLLAGGPADPVTALARGLNAW